MYISDGRETIGDAVSGNAGWKGVAHQRVFYVLWVNLTPMKLLIKT